MRSMFWRIFASFWLAIALVAGLAMLLGRAMNQDAWVINQHPAIRELASSWTQIYEQQGAKAAQDFLERRKRHERINTQVLNDDGQALVYGTFPRRAEEFESRQDNRQRLPWRRLTEEYTSPETARSYLFIYRLPLHELHDWQRNNLLWPISFLLIALVVLTVLSLLLTLSFTRPLSRLRSAVHDLGQTSYQQNSLAKLASRRDEFGLLADDFNRMGSRLQDLISSQRQLLRDVSHELRSPLARLRIALALAERAGPEQREQLWGRLTQECDRLDALIAEILTLARLDAEPGATRPIDLKALVQAACDDFALAAPEQHLEVSMSESPPTLEGWPDMLARALDNLLRNAQRFNPTDQPIELIISRQERQLQISVRDHGPGVSEELLSKLGEPFFRAPNQQTAGHGLGLAIAKRCAQNHGGQLLLANHPEGGFIASLLLPT